MAPNNRACHPAEVTLVTSAAMTLASRLMQCLLLRLSAVSQLSPYTTPSSAGHPADVTLVTSAVMKRELASNKCTEERIQVWQRGVDTSVFHPKFRSADFAAQAELCCSIVTSRQMPCFVGLSG